VTKPLHIFWSKAALNAAGPLMASLQRTLTSECGEIGFEARGSFVHVVEHENIGASFLCRGEEHDAEWRVFVQLARYETFDPMMRPLPEMPAVCKPIAVATDGNNDFRETHLIQ
jgi:hypothetical protein